LIQDKTCNNKKSLSRFILLLATVCFPLSVLAHAFGQRYDLPLPLNLYLWAAGAAVASSFIIVATLRVNISSFTRCLELGKLMPFSQVHSIPLTRFLQLLSLALFFLVLTTGLFADQHPRQNFAPVFVWVIWWVGFAYVSSFFGNLWDVLNPWHIIHRTLSWLWPSWSQPLLVYPGHAGGWPALVLFSCFAYLELISGIAHHPSTLAWLVVSYSLITLTGMRLFGCGIWLRHGEAFSITFGLMAQFAIFRSQNNSLQLRLPGAGLLQTENVSISTMLFVLLILCTVTFDGFIETPLWSDIYTAVYTSFSPETGLSHPLSPDTIQKLILSGAMLFFYSLFVGVYLAFCLLTSKLSTRYIGTITIARQYVLSLLPIAIAYHLAHYLSYLLISGQLIIPILSDPLTLGWDLFGTADYRINIGLIDAGDVWYLSLYAITIGHIIAVFIAHTTSLNYQTRRHDAVVSQLPMLLLMIAYTMVSLWILSQPIIAG